MESDTFAASALAVAVRVTSWLVTARVATGVRPECLDRDTGERISFGHIISRHL